MASIKSYFTALCEKYKDNIAFTVNEKGGDKNISFSELYDSVSALSSALSGYAGKRIIVTGKNSYYWALSALGVLCAGAHLVPVDQSLPDSEFCRIALRSEAEMIIYSDEMSEKVSALNIKAKLSMKSLSDFAKKGDMPETEPDGDGLSVLMFTSGTTSASKAVMLSANNILSNIYAMQECENFYETDVNLALLPYYHTFGLTSMLLFLGCGMRSVYAKGLRIKKALSDYKVTVFVGVPLILDRIKESAESAIEKSGKKRLFSAMTGLSHALLKIGIDARSLIFSSIRKKIGALRLVISGAAPLSESTIRFFDDIGILLIQGYGMTETSPVISAERENERRIGSVGKPMPGVDVKIDSPNGEGVGEILVKGPNVMLGYMGEEDQPFCDGYLKTGDLGYIDPDGFIFIRGRSKNVLVLKNGKNVYPEELESLMNALPGITESVAYLSPDSKTVSAIAVYDPESTTEEDAARAIESLNLNLSEYKKLRHIKVTTEPFPKTSTGKIKRNEIVK